MGMVAWKGSCVAMRSQGSHTARVFGTCLEGDLCGSCVGEPWARLMSTLGVKSKTWMAGFLSIHPHAKHSPYNWGEGHVRVNSACLSVMKLLGVIAACCSTMA